jgi:hypothetical protein
VLRCGRGEAPIPDQNKVEALIAKWEGARGGAEQANFAVFIHDLVDALELERPGVAQGGVLGEYQFEGPVAGGSNRTLGGKGRIDLYKRGCFVMEAKQSQLRPGETEAPGLFDAADVIPLTPAGARYDQLMIRAQAQAKNYAVNLPGDHPSVPFLIVCDVGRAFELFFDFAGNGRGYGFYPDKQRYRVPLAKLRDPEVQALLRDIWTEPRRRDPRLISAEVTREVSKRLADVSAWLEETQKAKVTALPAHERSIAVEETALFVMRLLFCMFAEDIGLLPENRFKEFLESTIDDQSAFENGLHDLWRNMNKAQSPRWSWVVREDVRYFNGGLFENDKVYVLGRAERGELLAAARHQWRNVEPAIFGTLLEQALSPTERAKLGAHYTPRAYVERLVDATIMEVLNAEWDAIQAGFSTHLFRRPGLEPGQGFSSDLAVEGSLGPDQVRADEENGADENLENAVAFHQRLSRVTVLDPACGTGNFLYVAMEAIERLEARVIETIEQLGGRAEPLVGPHQFFGLEKNPRAAKIAELVLWIGWLRFRIQNNPDSVPEPVLARGANINFGRHGGYDAVLRMTDAGEPDLETPLPAEWPEAEFIVGNPPFIGGKDMRSRLDPPGYAEAVWKANPRVPPSADFVMQWWDRAAHLLTAPGSTLRRFGFVTTNSITQEFSRRVIARYLASPLPSGEGQGASAPRGEGDDAFPQSPSPSRPAAPRGPLPLPQGEGKLSLIYAIPDHPWTKAGRDAAAVRIAMTVAERGAKPGCFAEVVREAALDSDAPAVELASTVAPINANLSIGADVTAAVSLKASAGICHDGVKLHGKGFAVTRAQAQLLGLGTREHLDGHIRPYRNGRDLTGVPIDGSREKLVLDFFGLDEPSVRQRFPEAYQHLLASVKPERDRNNRATYRNNWWIFGEPRRELRPALEELGRYIATVDTARHRLFQFLPVNIICDDKVVLVASDDAFHLGVLSSRNHVQWALAAGGWLGVGNDSVYVKSKVFDPFPFPDTKPEQRAAIGELAEELDTTRKAVLAEVPKLTMTELYNLREGLKAGTLDKAGEARALASRAAIVDRLHAQIDAEVAAAYGWPADLPPSEIVARLVALNAERAAEEKAGRVRWLRPDYQVPRFGGGAPEQ